MPLKYVYRKKVSPSNPPNVVIDGSANIQNLTVTQNVRPPRGQIWEVLIAAVQMSGYSSPSVGSIARVRLKFTDGTETVILKEDRITQGDGQNYEDVRVQVSGGTEVAELTFDKYLILEGTSDSTAGTITCDMLAITKVKQ